MEDWIINIMSQYGFWAILILIAVENIFPPIPSEVILTFGGVMTISAGMTIAEVVVAATLGSILGAIILYSVGRMLSYERLEKWIGGRLGRIMRLKQGDVDLARKKFEKRGGSSVFFFRMVPVVRSLISIPAGMSKMNMIKFLLLTLAGSLIWNIFLVYLGAVAGESWLRIVAFMDVYTAVAVTILVAAVIALGIYFFYKKRRIKKQ